jgi:pimeloyl-ACP methyl ester carboxylesterase
MVEHLSDEEFGEMCLEVLPFAVCDPARPARRELAERLGRMRFDPHAFARVLTLTQPEGKLELPTLIVHGKYDRVIWPTIGGQGLLHEIPNAELILFWKSGHFPFLEQPGPFVMVVEEFLRGRPSQPSALLA